MTELEEARRFALSLPEATEKPHFDKASFRVRGRIFATVPPDGQHLHVFVDAEEAHAAVAEDSTAFGELWWGKQLRGVRVSLPAAAPERVAELLEESWRRRAPKRLVAAFDTAFFARSSLIVVASANPAQLLPGGLFAARVGSERFHYLDRRWPAPGHPPGKPSANVVQHPHVGLPVAP